MGYSEFIGKPKIDTGVKGICYDFNEGLRIWLPPGVFHVKCVDLDTFTTVGDNIVNIPVGGKVFYFYQNHFKWHVEIKQDGKIICVFDYDAKDKNVLMDFMFMRGKLGDNIAAIVYIEEFRKKNQCRVFVVISQEFVEIFQRAYSEIIFIAGDIANPQEAYQKLPIDIYTTYDFHIYGCRNSLNNMLKIPKMLPVDARVIGFLQWLSIKLGVKLIQKPEKFFLPSTCERVIKAPYVCISGRGSEIKKEWNNAEGWYETVKYLKELGYRVLCIDGDGIDAGSPLEKAKQVGLEDFTGYRPLQERVDLLYGAEFFIGISSGLSWLAWGTGKPVILISGFSLPFSEFSTPYRIINYYVCNGCNNDMEYWGQKGDVGCFYENTNHYLECSRKIDPRVVCRNIDQLMQDYNLLPPKNRVIN